MHTDMEKLLSKPGSARYWIVAIIFIAAKLLLHFLTNTKYELLRDEMLFFNMGEHLSAGYATVPPVTGFIAFLSHKIFGFSVFGIRFFPAVLGAASIYLMALLVREIGGGIFALTIAAASYLFAPGFLLTGTLFTPNSFEEFIWILATLFIIKLVKTNKPVLWLPVGVLTGLGFLNKYSMLFLAAGIIPALFFSTYRRLLASRYFLMAILACLIIMVPNLIWQYGHGWPVIIHMSELRSGQLDLLGFLYFPTSLFSYCQGSIFISITGLVFLIFGKEEKQYRFIGLSSLIVFLLLLCLKGKGYYGLVIMPVLFAAGGYALEKYFRGPLLYVRNGLVAISLIMSLIALPSGLPVLSYSGYDKYVSMTRNFIFHPLLEWDNGTRHNFSQAYADMTGWNELAGIVAKAYNSLTDEEKTRCTIFGEKSYGYAGAVYFYGKRYGLPEAVTFHESYVFWAPDSIPDGPLIYIYRDRNDMDEIFSEVSEIGSVDNIYFREKGLKVFLCRSPREDVRKIYKDLAAEEKKRYSR